MSPVAKLRSVVGERLVEGDLDEDVAATATVPPEAMLKPFGKA